MAKIFKSPYTFEVPKIDIVSYIFSRGTPESRQAPQYFDAANPLQHYSLEDAERYVKRVALGLQKLDLKRGDKVMMFSSNHILVPVLFWSTIAAECVFTACSPSATVEELSYQLRDCQAQILLASPRNVDKALVAAEECHLPKDRIFVFGDLNLQSVGSCRPWGSIWAEPAEASVFSWRTIQDEKELKNTTAVINYSSGTTGNPKGVELSHYNVVSNSSQLAFKRGMQGDSQQAQRRAARLSNSGERWLAPLPMFHAYGQMYYCMNAPSCGAKVYIMKKFNLEHMLLYIDIYRITFMTCVPTILTMLAKVENPGRFNLRSVESVLTGSAPLSPELGKLVETRIFPGSGVEIKQGWGMTETTCSCSGFTPDDENDPHSVGWLNPNCEAKVVPVEDREFKQSVPHGLEAGELWISGPNVMKGYYNRPKETAGAFAYEDDRQWLKTGDIAYIDQRGNIHIIDRLKELIKVKGLQVSPTEVEQAILEHPGVEDAAVVRARHGGEEYVQAFIVRKQTTLKEVEILDFVKARLARHKWPTGGIHFLGTIPRTGSGKVQRRHLPKMEVKKTLSKL